MQLTANCNQKSQLLWVDLLEDVNRTSWFELASLVYHRNHGYSNFVNCRRRNHDSVRADVFKDERIKEYLAKQPELEHKFNKILDEMCHLLDSQTSPTRKLKIAGLPFLKCITRIYSSIYASSHLQLADGQFNGCNAVFKEQYLTISKHFPIVILPTHRSYMDFLLITFIMFQNELPLPVVAGGDNFKALGRYALNYLKGTGAFIIRRNAQRSKDVEASVYFDVLRSYMQTIIGGGEHPIEFFLEGTRTRTGQVLRPKTGLLSMVVDMFLKKQVPDIYVLPAAINYQRPIEEQLYIAETTPQVNKRKPKESIKNLYTAFDKIQRRKYGRVYVRFTKPIKLSEYFGEWSSSPSGRRDNVAVLNNFTNSLATKVCLDQAYNNILMPFNLLAISILKQSFFEPATLNLTSPTKSEVCLRSIMQDFYSIEELLVKAQSQFIPGWRAHYEIFQDLEMDRDGLFTPSPDRRSVQIQVNETAFHTLKYYANQVVQMLLPVAICTVIRQLPDADAMWTSYQSIRHNLSAEYVVNELSLRGEFENAMAIDWESSSTQEAVKMLVPHVEHLARCYVLYLKQLSNKGSISDEDFIGDWLNGHENKQLFLSKDMVRNMAFLVLDSKICRPKAQQPVPNARPAQVQLEVADMKQLSELVHQFETLLHWCDVVLRR